MCMGGRKNGFVTHGFQRKHHKCFDLRCPLSTWWTETPEVRCSLTDTQTHKHVDYCNPRCTYMLSVNCVVHSFQTFYLCILYTCTSNGLINTQVVLLLLPMQFQKQQMREFCRRHVFVKENIPTDPPSAKLFYRHLIFEQHTHSMFCFVPKVIVVFNT